MTVDNCASAKMIIFFSDILGMGIEKVWPDRGRDGSLHLFKSGNKIVAEENGPKSDQNRKETLIKVYGK